jgi:hypothetical protein
VSVTEFDRKLYTTFLGSGQSRLRKLRWPNVGVLRLKALQAYVGI